jgi:hypothetical protein
MGKTNPSSVTLPVCPLPETDRGHLGAGGIKVTRDLMPAGQLLKIEVLDHVIMGKPTHCSLRELGIFYT